MAKAHGKALVVHDRDSHDAVVRILLDEGAPGTVVFHCFSGDADMARLCVGNGWVLSFAGTVTFKNAENLREALRVTPLDQLLVETDAPFLTPMPYRGRPNGSYLVPLTLRAMAAVRGIDDDTLAAAIDATGTRVFGAF
jgi:TatD DNase family protein